MMAREVKTLLGVLVISVWREPDEAGDPVARLTLGHGVEEPPKVEYLTDPADILTAVQQWLVEISR